MVVLTENRVWWKHLPTEDFERLPKSAESYMHQGKFYSDVETCKAYIVANILIAWFHFSPEIVVVEDYAFSRNQRGSSVIRELGGVVKHWLWLVDALVIPFSSMTNKAYATGNGHAGKNEMVARAQQLWPTCPDLDDIADSFHLARYGHRMAAKLIESA